MHAKKLIPAVSEVYLKCTFFGGGLEFFQSLPSDFLGGNSENLAFFDSTDKFHGIKKNIKVGLAHLTFD